MVRPSESKHPRKTSAGFKDVPKFEIKNEDGSLFDLANEELSNVRRLALRARDRRDMIDLARTARDAVDLAVTPNGRPGDASPLAKPGYKGKRRLSDYEREIAHALMRKGHPESQAIAMARGLLKKAALRGKWGRHGKAGAATRAGAAASIAQRKTF